MRNTFKESFRQQQRADATMTYANTSFTTTGLATLVAASSTKYIRVWAMKVQAYVTTVLASATVGDPLLVVDDVIGTPVGHFRFEASSTATRAGQGGFVVAANDAVTVHYGWSNEDFGNAGFRLSAKNHALKVGLANTITTGVIAVRGWVLYSLES